MNRENQQKPTPQNDSSKPMDNRKDVERSNDEKIDQDFNGYPHAPAREDLMAHETDSHRTENNPASTNNSGVSERFATTDEKSDSRMAETENATHSRTDSTVNKEARNAETGVPQNASQEDLQHPSQRPGTDLGEAAGS
ncbi:MAG: hypothetical protein ACO1OO_01065 [Flavisolibacter sp.]